MFTQLYSRGMLAFSFMLAAVAVGCLAFPQDAAAGPLGFLGPKASIARANARGDARVARAAGVRAANLHHGSRVLFVPGGPTVINGGFGGTRVFVDGFGRTVIIP